MCEQRGVERDQFVRVPGLARQQHFAEIGTGIHLENHVGKLRVADFLEEQITGARGDAIAFRRFEW